MNEEAWIIKIDDCLGRRKKFSDEQRTLFAMALLKAIPVAFLYQQVAYPDNNHVKSARKKIKKLSAMMSSFEEDTRSLLFLSDIEQHVSKALKDTQGIRGDVEFIRKYIDLFSDFIEDTYNLTKTKRRNNPAALAVCQFVCHGYKRYLDVEPGTYDSDRIRQSGDENDGTPYERVCHAVGEQFAIQLPWTTQVQATKTYKRGLIDYKKMFPND